VCDWHTGPIVSTVTELIYTLSQKNLSTFYFLNNFVKDFPILMIFGMWNRDKICHQDLIHLPISPLSTVVAIFLPWGIQKVIFNNTTNMYLLLIICASQNKTNCNHDCELAHHIWKMSPPYLEKWWTFSPVSMHTVFLQNVGGSEKTGCDVWQLEHQASNVTASVHIDHFLHRHTFLVFFATDQSHRPACSAEIQSMCQQAVAATYPVSQIRTGYPRSCIMPQRCPDAVIYLI